MKNGLEIERRWLLGMLPDPNKANITYDIVQFYGVYPLPDGSEKPFRIRRQSRNGMAAFFLTEKTKTGPITNLEVESEIPPEEFDDLLKFCTNEVSKARFVFNHDGLTIEVDLYKHLRLVIMEVELESEDQHVELPDFIQKCIITEISGNEAFSNYNLSKLKK